MPRTRRRNFRIDREKIVARVLDFYERDLQVKSDDNDQRLQRYAKYRMWTEGKEFPWEDSSDIALPDMMEKSLRVKDTLVNAVLAQRPPLGSKAFNKADAEKERVVDNLIDYQVFVEQDGEGILQELAESFVDDGVFTAFIPWVRETREVVDVRIFPPIPEELEPIQYFDEVLRGQGINGVPLGDGWDWDTDDGQAKFYTSDDGVELVLEKTVEVFDGPKIIPKEYDEVYHPARAANLQIPGPSNPGGATHVILRDYPTVDEIKRLKKSGFYDLPFDVDDLENLEDADQDRHRDEQKDALGGMQNDPEAMASHRKITRLTCFDSFDIDGDGIDEDVIWWVLKEPKLLVKARHLTEMYPANPPRRPFAEAAFLPVNGRRGGISLLEVVEGLHDAMKSLMDQTIDGGTINMAPFGFYRPTSSMKPEVIRMAPGELYPLSDPQRDVHFPQIGNPQAQGFGINMVSILGTMEERLTMVGDLQLGRVPAGKSQALRTVGGMALLSGQGEARPERILRRFFKGLSEIWHQIHELNQRFLPDQKKIRMVGTKRASEDPYQEITDRGQIEGRFQFDFTANVLNSSKQAMQQSLGTMMQTFISEIAFALGVVDSQGAYRLFRDFARSLGHDADEYLREPSPGVGRPRVMAEEAIQSIVNEVIPDGEPMEPVQEHLQKLVEFEQSDQFGLVSETGLEIYRQWKAFIEQRLQEFMDQQRLLQAAQRFGAGQQGQPAQAPNMEQPQISGPAELLDETLPTAGGGG